MTWNLLGWGSIQHPGPSHHTLQQAMLPVVSHTNCFNRKDMVCTGFGRSSKTNACRGDSGGPYVCRRSDGRWEQHGVASFVVEYCKYYTAFTKVGDYYDWIYQVMANNWRTLSNKVCKTIGFYCPHTTLLYLLYFIKLYLLSYWKDTVHL